MLERKHFKLIKDYAFGGLYERTGSKNLFSALLSNVSFILFDAASPF
jgi:hypothetical protein